MHLVVRPLHPLFAAELRGLDLDRDIDLETQQAIEHAMDEYAVCVVPEQKFDDERQIAFSRHYGPLENASAVKAQRKAGVIGQRIRHPEIFDVSNLDENGNIMAANDDRWVYRQANELWHTDSSFRQKSSTWSLLHARIVPPSGGDTYFADTRAAYDALPEATKQKLESLVAEHSIWYSRGQRGGYVPSDEERAARPPAQIRGQDLRQVTAVRCWSLSEATRVVIEVSGEFEFRAERAHDPERIFFDVLRSKLSWGER